ncbi:hypothetical protein GYMLUDRAFT_59700 [Collybiopsis luxurians FD-317 M1]|uniref:Uncharacterized protein n=1 Tax=Collybiopsis luxurians FD-317 M1 TaxID=944289 RepID=A0A0D0B9D4_9AGAR|nr:hypothetical protein GYMLUDRAFT_59700 [Collybiopsis luxurians FD-317 M1]
MAPFSHSSTTSAPTPSTLYLKLVLPANECSAPAKLTAGKVTPEAWNLLKENFLDYYDFKGIAVEDQVCKDLSSFKDLSVCNWIAVNCTELVGLKFDKFAKCICAFLLEPDWEDEVYCKMHNQCLPSNFSTSVYDYALGICNMNSILEGTPLHQDNKGLIELIVNGLDEDMTECYNKVKKANMQNKTHPIFSKEFCLFISELESLNNNCCAQYAIACSAAESLYCQS